MDRSGRRDGEPDRGLESRVVGGEEYEGQVVESGADLSSVAEVLGALDLGGERAFSDLHALRAEEEKQVLSVPCLAALGRAPDRAQRLSLALRRCSPRDKFGSGVSTRRW